MGGNMNQVVKAFAEAEAYDGPSLIIAYSPCIAHGIEMGEMMDHQKAATSSGYWELYRFDPRLAASSEHPFKLDSPEPSIPFAEFARTEARFAMLKASNPDEAERLMTAAQADIDERRRYYEQLAGLERGVAGEEITA
jgi:pyruvate-ferredoxin/flavodoxin oxidoreductase